MSVRELPARPHLDHLKHEAKALLKAWQLGDPTALQRAREALGDKPLRQLSQSQRVLAREYGFSTWAMLRDHVVKARGDGNAVDAFLAAAQRQDAGRAREILQSEPGIGAASLHVAAALGLAAEAKRLIAKEPTTVHARVGDPPADPLLFLCHSPFHGESQERDQGLIATARALLEAGADPNTRDSRFGVPVLYAVTGARSVIPIARLLLEAGANPTDGESLFHAAEHFREDALELLLAAGADVNFVGDWGNTALYFLLRHWDVRNAPRVRQGIVWLLGHGADPNILCGDERETSLHVAVRRGQPEDIIALLIEKGAMVDAVRGDGATAWLLAQRAGRDELAARLEDADATPRTLSALDQLLAACERGDVAAAGRLATPEVLRAADTIHHRLLPEAAARGDAAAVAAYIAASFPVNVTDANGATALHYSAIHGRAVQVKALLAAGATTNVRDKDHRSTPLGWASYGADFVKNPGGDYVGCVSALLHAGAQQMPDEYLSEDPQIRQLFAPV